MAAKLTPKQSKFIDEYLIDLNATQAAIRAGYSAKTAQRIGSENLSKPLLRAEIEKRQQKTEKKLEISRERIIEELISVAMANGADFAEIIDTDGLFQTAKFRETAKLPPEKRAAISSIKSGSSGIEVKTYDKLRAIELLGKYLGYLDGNNGGAPSTSLADAVVDAYKKRTEGDGNANE